MSIFDALSTAEQAMNVHRYRSQIAAQNMSNAHAPGYKRQEVDLVATPFGAEMNAARAGNSAVSYPGSDDAVAGAVQVGKVKTVDLGPDSGRQQALMAAIDMMEAKTAYEYAARSAAMFKSMAMAGLRIGQGM